MKEQKELSCPFCGIRITSISHLEGALYYHCHSCHKGVIVIQCKALLLLQGQPSDCWFCKHCGTKNANGAGHCSGCGMPREEADEDS